MTSTDSAPVPNGTRLKDGGKQLALIVYVLYFVGFATGITWLAGVIVAHMNVGNASETFRSHFAYQIRTFWFGLVISIIGVVLALALIGFLILALLTVWILVRCIKGVMRLSNDQPIEDPMTLLW